MPPNSKSRYRLCVEGKDDQWSIIGLLARHGFDWEDAAADSPYVHDCGGVDKLLDAGVIAASLKTYRRLGWVLDADLEPLSRWAQIRDALAKNGLSVPGAPPADGLVIPGLSSDSRVGVWLMPDNSAPGCLEDFLGKLVPGGDACWTHAGSSTEHARTIGAPLAHKDLSKGAVHAWLAWRETPGMPFGTAWSCSSIPRSSRLSRTPSSRA